MAPRENQKFGNIFKAIGEKIIGNPKFLEDLEHFLKSYPDKNEFVNENIDYDKINRVNLIQLGKEKTEEELEEILSDFSLKELRELLKKYHLGSPSKLKTNVSLIKYAVFQLKQRSTDVFRTTANDRLFYEKT